jgi:hypothetical protein
MVMLRPGGKARKIAEHVMKSKGVTIPKAVKRNQDEKTNKLMLTGPSLQH